MYDEDPRQAEALLGWWYVHSGNADADARAAKPTPPPQPRRKTGRRGGR